MGQPTGSKRNLGQLDSSFLSVGGCERAAQAATCTNGCVCPRRQPFTCRAVKLVAFTLAKQNKYRMHIEDPYSIIVTTNALFRRTVLVPARDYFPSFPEPDSIRGTRTTTQPQFG